MQTIVQMRYDHQLWPRHGASRSQKSPPKQTNRSWVFYTGAIEARNVRVLLRFFETEVR